MKRMSGVSLISVMVALSLGLIGALFFLRYQSAVFIQSKKAHEITTLSSYAESIMNYYRLKNQKLPLNHNVTIDGTYYRYSFLYQEKEEQEHLKLIEVYRRDEKVIAFNLTQLDKIYND